MIEQNRSNKVGITKQIEQTSSKRLSLKILSLRMSSSCWHVQIDLDLHLHLQSWLLSTISTISTKVLTWHYCQLEKSQFQKSWLIIPKIRSWQFRKTQHFLKVGLDVSSNINIDFTILFTDRFSETMSRQQMLEFEPQHETLSPPPSV